ncbi:hypothetical protein ACLB0R_00685 [Sphingomonas sp. GlSt437]|uniref:hypothetical protein n=1 Tax=Sphingomonas sp. GlSt437 TaxID=3389970 RepID=UPI003EBB80AE
MAHAAFGRRLGYQAGPSGAPMPAVRRLPLDIVPIQSDRSIDGPDDFPISYWTMPALAARPNGGALCAY